MHYYSCESRPLLLKSHVNMADKNRTFLTEFDRNLVWLGQILISLQFKVYNLEYLPKWIRNPP